MENSLKKHQNIVTFVSIVLSVFILYISLLEQKDLPKIEIKFIDKLVHIFIYFVLFLFYRFGFFSRVKKNLALLITVVFTFSFGFLIEVLQTSVTATRHFDIFDLVANFIGLFLAFLLLRLLRTEK